MHLFLLILVGFFGSVSYVVGVWQMMNGTYEPNVFSRVVWLLLAINSFAGVVVSHSTQASILLGGVLLVGNAAVCLVSFWKGTMGFGKLEIFCSALLAVSALIWVLFNAPLVNLLIGLAAHFIGAIPTYKKVWADPQSESPPFWSLFLLASALSIIASFGSPVREIILPIYYTFFDGSMFLLSLRKRFMNK